MSGINRQKISRMIDLSRSTQYVTALKSIILVNFQKIKNELIQEFKNHPVTIEIEGGPDAQNISRTLGGKGNLFSFIGFNEGDKPTRVIYDKLESITLGSTIIMKDGGSRTTVMYPTADDIFDATPMPWAEGRSWARGIESGISGLGLYLNKKDIGRSSAGIQRKSKAQAGKFRNTKYISKMIKDFERKILTLDGIRIG
jgi:hypothetical protein